MTATYTDRFGMPVTTRSIRALEAYDEGMERALSFGVAPELSFERAVAEDPDFALAHAALAMTRLREMRVVEARESAGRSTTLAGGLFRRERQHVQAVVEQVSGRGLKALGLMREHLLEFPLDALLLNATVSSLLFAGRQDEMVQVTELARPAYPDADWFSLGAHAFALQEVRRFDEARSAAEAAIAAYAPAAFASHALAHVFYELGDNEAGMDFLPAWLAAYDRGASLHLHLSWHLALFYLARGEYRRALELYERDIRPEMLPIQYSLFDPVSLLWRLEVFDCSLGHHHWSELGTIAGIRAASTTIFNDLHHGMALARIGDRQALDGLLDSFRARGERGNATAGEVALPLLQGMIAFADSDYAEAVRLIEPIEERIFEVGGSRAQREVFHDTLLQALLRTGSFERAEQRLRDRLSERPAPRDFYRLGLAYGGSGQEQKAAEAHREARTRWSYLDSDAPEALRLRL